MRESEQSRSRRRLTSPIFRKDVGRLLLRLWHAYEGNKLQASLNAVIGLVGVGVSLGQVWAVQHAIDVASGAMGGSVYWAVGLLGGLVLCGLALGVAGVWVRNILGIRAQNRMQQRMLDRILRSEWHGKEARHSGDVLNRLELDVGYVVGFLTETIPSTLSVLALFVVPLPICQPWTPRWRSSRWPSCPCSSCCARSS